MKRHRSKRICADTRKLTFQSSQTIAQVRRFSKLRLTSFAVTTISVDSSFHETAAKWLKIIIADFAQNVNSSFFIRYAILCTVVSLTDN